MTNPDQNDVPEDHQEEPDDWTQAVINAGPPEEEQ